MGLRVAQATRQFRPATRRTELERQLEPWAWPFRSVARGSSGRRVVPTPSRERVARATHFQNTLSMLLSAQRGNSTFEMNDVELLREYVARGCQDAFS